MPTENIELFYIGPKPVKRDNVAGSDFVWLGYGASQDVPSEIARKLMKFPTVWATEEEFKKLGEAKPAAPVKEKPKAQEAIDELAEDAPAEKPVAITGNRDAAIKAAIFSMDRDNPDNFSARTGAPMINAVKAVVGDESITFKEVAAVWAEIKAEHAK